jgi:hypothetical protein
VVDSLPQPGPLASGSHLANPPVMLGGRWTAMNRGWGSTAAGRRHNCPRQIHFLRVLWTGQAEVLQPCQ